jgi:hypothetical protein
VRGRGSCDAKRVTRYRAEGVGEMTKGKVERWTLWVLAVGVLIAVTLNVAKWVVRDYKDLEQEIHRPVVVRAENDGSAR